MLMPLSKFLLTTLEVNSNPHFMYKILTRSIVSSSDGGGGNLTNEKCSLKALKK